jgi:hypothetical protein
LRRVWFIIGGNCFLYHYADRPISHGFLYPPAKSRCAQPHFSSLRVAGHAGHEWFIGGQFHVLAKMKLAADERR